MKIDTKRDILYALYIAAMIIVNLVGTKISTVGGVRISVGILFMPILFVIADVISEVYGKSQASKLVNLSVCMLIFMFISVFVCIKMPANATWGLQKQYEAVFAPSLRMTFASVLSFFVSQKIDVAIFLLFKKLTKSKYLFIRNNISTIISQFFDTVLFMFLAFWKTTDSYTASFVFSLVIPYWIFKIVLALLDTPFCYLGVAWLKGFKSDSSQDSSDSFIDAAR